MGALKNIIYNCRQATYLIEKRQHTRLSFREWMELMIHLAGCSVCRLFRRQSRLIQRLMHQFFGQAANRQYHLDESRKEEMQRRIDERLP